MKGRTGNAKATLESNDPAGLSQGVNTRTLRRSRRGASAGAQDRPGSKALPDFRSNTGERDWEEPVALKVSPDINRCQALKIGFGEWVDCLMPEPQHCPHAVAFGLSFYCTHPNRAEIVARSLRPSILSVRRPIRGAIR